MNYWATKEIKTFDAEGYINEVFEKYASTENEESREALQRQWDATLSMPRGGDASLYPNAHGPRPALLDVWHKAGDFWRAGYRLGDVLYCDQHGFPLYDWMFDKIRQAKGEDVATEETPAQATETPQDAPTGESGVTAPDTDETPTAATETATEETETDEKETDEDDYQDMPLFATARKLMGNTIVREGGKFVLTIAALVIIWECGLIIPFALLGGLAAGVVK